MKRTYSTKRKACVAG